MYLEIETSEKAIVLKHIEEALESKELVRASMQKLSSGLYHLTIGINSEEPEITDEKNNG